LTPADRRAGDRTAIDDLGIGVLIVDDEERIINANETAAGIFGRSKRALLGSPLGRIDDDIALAATDQRLIRGEGAGRREYAVTVSPITDSADTAVGHTVTLGDITAERQREQRLAVLNRVLRHNLRNDLNVATGYLDIVREGTDDDDHRRMLETAARNTESVIALGEKARTVERTLDSDREDIERIALRSVLEELAAEYTDAHGGTVDTDVPADLVVESDRRLLESVCGNILENALEHGGREPRATVEARATDGTLRLVISDTGPGIPEHELRVIEQGEETDLEHGSGIGLWLVEWGATALGGVVNYEIDETGTTATVTLPGVVVEGHGDGRHADEVDVDDDRGSKNGVDASDDGERENAGERVDGNTDEIDGGDTGTVDDEAETGPG